MESNWSLNPEILSRSGFYYSSSGDYLSCFSCSATVRQLNSNFDIWSAHERSCELLNVQQTVEDHFALNKKRHEDWLCICCFEEPLQILLQPCNHVVLCVNCSQKLIQFEKMPKIHVNSDGTTKDIFLSVLLIT
jgi:hypothetical protein